MEGRPPPRIRGDPEGPPGPLRRGLAHARALLPAAFGGLGRHSGTQLAAGMAYYALLSVVPAATVLAAIAGRVLDDPDAREDAIDRLIEDLPLTEGQGRADLERLLDGMAANAATLGVVGALGLLITASALITAARSSVNVIFETETRRGAIRGKALDVALMLGLGLLLASSFALTLIGRLGVELGGPFGGLIGALVDVTGFVLPLAMTAVVFAALYVILPAHRPPLRDVWPGVIVATAGYELLKRGFSIYLENFANYDAVYGSLGAVIAFLFFVYLASIAFLLGAEVAAVWPRARAGELGTDQENGEPFGERIRGTLIGLFRRGPVQRDQNRDAEGQEDAEGEDDR